MNGNGISVTLNINYLEQVLRTAELGSPAVASGMARYIAERTAEETLTRSSHAPGEWHRQRPGEPPAIASGNLAESMYARPASGGLRASALAGTDAEYSRILEFGCVITHFVKRMLHWADSGGSWYHHMLAVPAHPYLSVTTDEAMRDGGLQQAAIEEFAPYDP